MHDHQTSEESRAGNRHEPQPTQHETHLAGHHESKQQRNARRVKIATYIIFGFSAVLAVYIFIQNIPPPFGKYDAFARCIADSGTKFYGASWCPHCAAQKAEFGDAAQYLPYVECSLNGGTAQTQVCIDHDIKNYPTWVFPDGSRQVGTTGLALLAQKTGCSLTGNTSSSNVTSTQVGSSSPAY